MRHLLTHGSLVVLLGLAGCWVGDEPGPSAHAHAADPAPLFGINVPADGTASDVVSDLGASWVRLELVEGAPSDALAATLADYHARGVHVLLIVDYASLAGFTGAACSNWSSWRAAWLGRLSQVAAQLATSVDAWEIWNEPDQPQLACNAPGYNPGMPARDYGLLLRDANQALRAAGATGPIVTGGLDSGQVSYVTDAAAAAAGLHADGVSIHPYGVVPDPSWCPAGGEDLNCDWGTLGGKVDEYSAATGLPVWVTEFGVKSADTQHQARYVTDAYAAFASRGDKVGHVFLFCLSDAMVAPFGLTFADYSPKPGAYAAYKALTAGSASGGGSGDHAKRLHGTVHVGATDLAGLAVTAWGQARGDLHATTTDALGIYQFANLDAAALYNVVVNAEFDPAAEDSYTVIDGAHGFEVRNNVELVAGPDQWHGEDFDLAY